MEPQRASLSKNGLGLREIEMDGWLKERKSEVYCLSKVMLYPVHL